MSMLRPMPTMTSIRRETIYLENKRRAKVKEESTRKHNKTFEQTATQSLDQVGGEEHFVNKVRIEPRGLNTMLMFLICAVCLDNFIYTIICCKGMFCEYD